MVMSVGQCRLEMFHVVWAQLNRCGPEANYLSSGLLQDVSMPTCIPSFKKLKGSRTPAWMPPVARMIVEDRSSTGTGTVTRRSLEDAIRSQVCDPILAKYLRISPLGDPTVTTRESLPAGERESRNRVHMK